jgi:magnesium-transporting ATPase (P-type)
MYKFIGAPQKIIFTAILTVINIVGAILIGIVFLGASNGNGEGAPLQSEFEGFVRRFIFVLIVSLFFSALSFGLAHSYRKFLPKNNFYIKNLFWIHLALSLLIFMIAYLYLSLRITI